MAINKSEIKKLIEDVDKKSLNLTSEQKNEIAEVLADFLKKEKDNNYLGHYTIKQDDVNNKNSLFDDFQKLIDLDSQDSHYLQYIEDIIKDQNNGSHENWNESIKYTIEYFRTHFRPYSQGNEIEVNGNGYEYNAETKTYTEKTFSKLFTIAETILKANAGYSFKNSPWVMPNVNIDEQSYDNVRGADKINSVLKSQKNMDFTHTQTTGDVDSEGKQLDDGNQVTKYIRLLMPRYTRRVEVEDLNRNFWVIGQVLTAVCAYLFDDDSPIMNMFKRLLNENVQIWENLLYLWAAISLLGEKNYIPYDSDHIRCEVVYLPNDSWNHEMKFDGYDVTVVGSLADCKDRLKYLVDMYPDKHLCILPIVRKNNYFKNYYSQEVYYGILCYDRNSGEWQDIKFNENRGVIIQKEDGDKLYYIKEGEGKYLYCQPNATIASQDKSWIQVIRSYIDSFSCNYNNNQFLPKLVVNIYDAGYYAINKNKGSEKTAINYGNGNDYYANPRDNYITSSGNTKSEKSVPYIKGIYLCELTSIMGSPGVKPDPHTFPRGTLLRVGNYTPKFNLNDNTIVDLNGNYNLTPAGLGLMTYGTSSDNIELTDTAMGTSIYIASGVGNSDILYYNGGAAQYEFYFNNTNGSNLKDLSRFFGGSDKYDFEDSAYNMKISSSDNVTYGNLSSQAREIIKSTFANGFASLSSNSISYFCISYGTSPWIGGRTSTLKNNILRKIGAPSSLTTYQGRLYYADAFVTHICRVITGQTVEHPIETINLPGGHLAYLDKIIPLKIVDSVNGIYSPTGIRNFFVDNNGYWRNLAVRVINEGITVTDPIEGVIEFVDVNRNNKVTLSYHFYESNGTIQIDYDSEYTYGININNQTITGSNNLPNILLTTPAQNAAITK